MQEKRKEDKETRSAACNSCWRVYIAAMVRQCKFEFDEPMVNATPLSYLITKKAQLLNADWSTKRVFFLILQGGKITRSRLVLRLPTNSLCYREVVAEKICNNGAPFRDSWREICWRIEKQEEKHGVLKEHFQKLSEWKKLPSKFRRVGERCPRPNTVAVLCIQKLSNFALSVINK